MKLTVKQINITNKYQTVILLCMYGYTV